MARTGGLAFAAVVCSALLLIWGSFVCTQTVQQASDIEVAFLAITTSSSQRW